MQISRKQHYPVNSREGDNSVDFNKRGLCIWLPGKKIALGVSRRKDISEKKISFCVVLKQNILCGLLYMTAKKKKKNILKSSRTQLLQSPFYDFQESMIQKTNVKQLPPSRRLENKTNLRSSREENRLWGFPFQRSGYRKKSISNIFLSKKVHIDFPNRKESISIFFFIWKKVRIDFFPSKNQSK